MNQYTSVDGTDYSYDDSGNLTDDGTYDYYYDCENRLMDVNDANSQRVATYSYDYKGRRIYKTINGTITSYCYDGDQVIAEYDANDTLLRKFIYGPSIDEPIMMIDVEDENAKYYYHYDALGSVAALSNVNGDIVEKYEYDVFGEPNRVSNVNNPYMFTGRRYDNETGLYYYRARYYNPEIGRFLQPDPVGYEDSLNLYTYVRNNPINLVDPFGLRSRYTRCPVCRGYHGDVSNCWNTCHAHGGTDAIIAECLCCCEDNAPKCNGPKSVSVGHACVIEGALGIEADEDDTDRGPDDWLSFVPVLIFLVLLILKSGRLIKSCYGTRDKFK